MHRCWHDDPSAQEAQMLKTSFKKEVATLRQNLLAQEQKLDAAQQRVAELETQLSKKEHLIIEQKKFLEDVKCQARWVWTSKARKEYVFVGKCENCSAQLLFFNWIPPSKKIVLSKKFPFSCVHAERNCRPRTAGIRPRGKLLSCCRQNSCSSTAEWKWKHLPPLPLGYQQGAEVTHAFMPTPGQS